MEYTEDANKRIRLFELANSRVLETIFDADGAVIRTSILQSSDLKSALAEFLNSFPEKPNESEKNFEEVKLKKQCPHCGSDTLARSINIAKNQVPIVPIYECRGCGGKSYYLTADYLRYLVLSNKGLFEKQELCQLEANENEFLGELSEYIVRIFASKKIKRIN
ncbi:MAG: hypothetical protein M1331_02855 [Candidatus Marsarchaeota archaeon]|nr:hypothetical protein [Candidatus Marsarchaeota archaeon]MCL5106306.1 hypothetical protein [Candidatus Marsarchaeota archaeon]